MGKVHYDREKLYDLVKSINTSSAIAEMFSKNLISKQSINIGHEIVNIALHEMEAIEALDLELEEQRINYNRYVNRRD